MSACALRTFQHFINPRAAMVLNSFVDNFDNSWIRKQYKVERSIDRSLTDSQLSNLVAEPLKILK